jgi:hypothetical protein
MRQLNSLNSATLYPPLHLPALTLSDLKKSLPIQTRYFYADSVSGRQGKVVRWWTTPKGSTYVRVNYGKNLGGQSLLKTMCLDALALSVE